MTSFHLFLLVTAAVVAASSSDHNSASEVSISSATPILVNASAPLGAVSPTLFGLDLEITRHDIWEGLSAQLVANRAFAVQPPGTIWPFSWPAGFPPRWRGVGGVQVAGSSRAMVCVLSESNQLCGVQQDAVADGFNAGRSFGSAIGLQAGHAYSLRVESSVEGGSGISLYVELPGVVSGTLLLPPGNSTLTDYNFTSTVTLSNVSMLLVTAAGQTSGTLTLHSVSLLPVEGVFLSWMRADVVAQLGALGFSGPLRYPGGCFAPFYSDWRGQVQSDYWHRPVIFTPPDYCTAVAGGVNAYSDGVVSESPNVDEYVALCRVAGVMPAITLSLQFGTPNELLAAASLVEYCNGNATTQFGSLRAARNGGDTAPYNVSVFYLGNEMNMQQRYADYPAVTSAVPPPSAAEYATMAAAMAAAVLAVDPNVQLVAVEGGSGWDAAWAASPAASAISATSFHGGYATSGPGGSPSTLEDFTAQARIPSTAFLSGLQALRSTLNSVAGGAAAHVAISADEWGLGPPWMVATFNAAHGMYAASLLTVLINNADELGVRYSNYFEPINEGAIDVMQFYARPTPLGLVLPLFASYGGTQRLAFTVGSSATSIRGASAGDDLAVAAALSGDGRGAEVLVTLSNLNSTSAIDVALQLLPPSGRSLADAANSSLLTSQGLPASNCSFALSRAQLPVSPAGLLAVTVPAYSVLQLSVTLV